MEQLPIVIDVEASGLYGYSYPISLAWASGLEAVEYHVIRPEPTWLEGGDWDEYAEAIHGFTIEQLLEVGEPASFVAKRVAEALRGRVVYSDAPDCDQRWLDVLHCAAGVERTYDIADVTKVIPALRLLSEPEIDGLRAQAFAECGGVEHTADGDVKMLLTMMRMPL